MPYSYHTHYYCGTTTLSHEHVHEYTGMTSCDPDTDCHVHYMIGQTTLNNRHIHCYSIVTSPPIQVNGGHIHYYESPTSYDYGHIHYMCSYTGLAT